MAIYRWNFPLNMVIFHSYVKLPEGTPLTPPSQRLRGRVWHLRLCLCNLRCFGALGRRGLVRRRQLDVGQHQLPAIEVASQEAHGIAQGMRLHHSFGLDERVTEGSIFWDVKVGLELLVLLWPSTIF